MPARRKKTRPSSARPKHKPASRTRRRPTAKRAAAKPQGPPGAGVFVWHELATPDVAASKGFYTGLFGWTSHEMPMGGGVTYTLFGRGGADIAGCMSSRGQGMESPPMWLLYVAVDDVDAYASKARSLGARILVDPRDIPGVGRFSVLADPQGATIALFKPSM